MRKETVKWLKTVGKAAAAHARVHIAKAIVEEPALDEEVWSEDARKIVAQAFSKAMR